MRITFILPRPSQKPIGGYRVVYEYADRLAGRGHQVTVLFSLAEPLGPKWPLWERKLEGQLLNPFPRWFKFKNRVQLSIVPEITDLYIPDGDAVFATWWASSYGIKDLSANKGEKYYLIQHHEVWGGPIG